MGKTIIQLTCPVCGKMAHEKSRYELGNELWIDLECGHTIIKDALKTDDIQIESKDGRKPFPFQIESAKFLEEADCNGLCLHEQGLGKTIIECLILKRNPQLLPALVVVKSGLRAQWFAEIFRWTGMLAQVITSSREQPNFDMFDIIIVSVDTLARLRPDVKIRSAWDDIKDEAQGKTPKKNKPVWSDETCAKFKHIAVDESQKIKNPGSSRTQALRKIAALANNGQKARVICYSGTNIEKHAGEYFVTLNLTRPELFPQQASYVMNHCEIDQNTGKPKGLKNPARFKEMTKDFIIRYKREDVLPDLPKIFRQFRLAEMEGGELDAYIELVKEFQLKMKNDDMLPTDVLGYLSRMRHITGIAKVNAACEFIEEFLLESERKLVVFLHHKIAMGILLAKLAPIMAEGAFAQPLVLPGGLKLGEGSEIIEKFRRPENRILIASTQASAEGYNMQFVQDCLFMERQWNPSTEEQAEGRFPRPRPEDPWPVGAKINAHYLIAAGTIDDFLTEIVEQKRRNVAQTLDGVEVDWDETSLQAELAKALMKKGLAKWKLKAA